MAWLQAGLTGVAAYALWWLWRRFVAGAAGDRAAIFIVAAGFVVRALAAQSLFWISWLHLPFLRSLQLGNGFWFFAPDGIAYLKRANDVLHGTAKAFTLQTTYPSHTYVEVLALFVAAFGSVASVAILLNCAAYLGACVLLLRTGSPDRVSRSFALLAISFGPGAVLWAMQPLKEALFLLLAVTIVAACAAWQERWRGPAGRGVLVPAAGILVVLYALAGVRWYFAVFIWGFSAVFYVLVALPAPRRRRALLAGLSLFLLSAFVVRLGGSGDMVPFMAYLGRELRLGGARSSPVTSVAVYVGGVRAGFENTPGATTIAAGAVVESAVGPENAPPAGPATALPGSPAPGPVVLTASPDRTVGEPVPATVNPDVKPVAPAEAPAAPEAKVVNPVVEPAAPEAKVVNPVVEPAAPDVKAVKPAVEPAAPEVKAAKPAVEPAAPEVKAAKPAVVPAAPEVKAAKPVVVPAAPEVKAAKPAVVPAAPEVKAVKPVVEPAAPEVKAAKPVVAPVAPEVKTVEPDVVLAASEVKAVEPAVAPHARDGTAGKPAVAPGARNGKAVTPPIAPAAREVKGVKPPVKAVETSNAPVPSAPLADPAPAPPRTTRARLITGAVATFVPRSIAGPLGWIDIRGGRGLWAFVDLDTIVLDAVLLFALVAIVRAVRRKQGSLTPLFVLVFLVFAVTAVLMIYAVSNFGTLFRLRQMLYVLAAVLPLTLGGVPRIAREPAESQDAGPYPEN